MQFMKSGATTEVRVELWVVNLTHYRALSAPLSLQKMLQCSTACSIFCTFIQYTQPLQSKRSACSCTVIGIFCHWYLCIIFYVIGDSFYKTKKGFFFFFFYIVCFVAWGEPVNLHEARGADKVESWCVREVQPTRDKNQTHVLQSKFGNTRLPFSRNHVTEDRGILPLNWAVNSWTSYTF